MTVWAQDFCRNARSENRRDPAGRKIFRDEAVRQKDKSKQASYFRTVPIDHLGDISVWNVSTDEETVGAALFEPGIIDGEETAFGLFVTTVNGVVAEGNSWWAFWIDGEPALAGLAIDDVGSTVIEAGRMYAIVYTN